MISTTMPYVPTACFLAGVGFFAKTFAYAGYCKIRAVAAEKLGKQNAAE